jgi:hypothetical protein
LEGFGRGDEAEFAVLGDEVHGIFECAVGIRGLARDA